LVGLSPDAEPALAKLGARAPCAVASLRRRLRAPDGLAGANLARTRARAALRGVPAPTNACPERSDWG